MKQEKSKTFKTPDKKTEQQLIQSQSSSSSLLPNLNRIKDPTYIESQSTRQTTLDQQKDFNKVDATRPLKGKNLKNEIIDSLMTSSDDSGIQGLKATTMDKKPAFQLPKNTTPVLNNLSTSETYNQKE